MLRRVLIALSLAATIGVAAAGCNSPSTSPSFVQPTLEPTLAPSAAPSMEVPSVATPSNGVPAAS